MRFNIVTTFYLKDFDSSNYNSRRLSFDLSRRSFSFIYYYRLNDTHERFFEYQQFFVQICLALHTFQTYNNLIFKSSH